jgi:hypothetical protein
MFLLKIAPYALYSYGCYGSPSLRLPYYLPGVSVGFTTPTMWESALYDAVLPFIKSASNTKTAPPAPIELCLLCKFSVYLNLTYGEITVR